MAYWKGWDRQPPAAEVVVKRAAERVAEPMTDAQARYLRTLCNRAGEKFNPSWTKKQATKRINQLRHIT